MRIAEASRSRRAQRFTGCPRASAAATSTRGSFGYPTNGRNRCVPAIRKPQKGRNKFSNNLNDEIRFSVPVVSRHANDNERAALMEFLTDTIERDRFPLSPRVKRLSGVLAVVAMVAMPLLVAAEPLERCDSGQQVTDDVGNPGQIVGGRGGLCLVRSPDGRSQTWVSVNRLSPASPAEPDASADGPKKEAPPPPDGAPPKPSPGEVSKEQNP
jgi:hypothetical protein